MRRRRMMRRMTKIIIIPTMTTTTTQTLMMWMGMRTTMTMTIKLRHHSTEKKNVTFSSVGLMIKGRYICLIGRIKRIMTGSKQWRIRIQPRTLTRRTVAVRFVVSPCFIPHSRRFNARHAPKYFIRNVSVPNGMILLPLPPLPKPLIQRRNHWRGRMTINVPTVYWPAIDGMTNIGNRPRRRYASWPASNESSIDKI